MAKRKGSMGTLTCTGCGVSGAFPIPSPAAPVLTMCEAAEKEGWSYEVGFFSMLTGNYNQRCPKCNGNAAKRQ